MSGVVPRDEAASFYLLCLQLRLEAAPPGGRAKRLFVLSLAMDASANGPAWASFHGYTGPPTVTRRRAEAACVRGTARSWAASGETNAPAE